MKKKALTMTALAMAMMMVGGVSGIHAEDTQDTTITYSNQAEVGSDPEWAVTIPTSIAIDETSVTKTITIEAVSKVAGKDITALLENKTVNIAITSKNGYELKLKEEDSIKYELDKTSMELTAEKSSDTATVTLKGIAKQSGDYTDILTFSLTTTENTSE